MHGHENISTGKCLIHDQEIWSLCASSMVKTEPTKATILMRSEGFVPVTELESQRTMSKPKPKRKRSKRRAPRFTGVSKQRKTANARERNRVRTVNDAFETLRKLVPVLPTEKKPSKIETIRLAALYIDHLTEMLRSIENCERTTGRAREKAEATNSAAHMKMALELHL